MANSDRLLKPKSFYDNAHASRQQAAIEEAQKLADFFAAHEADLAQHGYTVSHTQGMVAIQRNGLDIVRVIFNYSDTGRHRIINGVAEALKRGIPVDLLGIPETHHEAKVQLQNATDLLYSYKTELNALGLL